MAKKRKKKKGERKHTFIHKGVENLKVIQENKEKITKEKPKVEFLTQEKSPDLFRFITIASAISVLVAALYFLNTRTEILSNVLQKLGI